MPRLGVNVDHVATLREARKIEEPDPVAAAVIVELAGAHGIVCHLREDRRHIKERDLYLLRQIVKTKLNLEMAANDEIIKIALDVKPDKITLVPERREELTTEGGLDVAGNMRKLRKVVKKFSDAGLPVSMFIEADPRQIEASKEVGAQEIEIHTGRYSEAKSEEEAKAELEKITEGVKIGLDMGLVVHAGHGLNYRNVQPIARIPGIDELNIGHSIIGRAVFVGLERAVREMLELIRTA
ncbi:pyridoxine 5'-phosphate synthase [Candidatus Poribacteria bacterium]|nr:pyridoxine 5'-phosphate synthase [Candidatus Poribacteria bacterium]